MSMHPIRCLSCVAVLGFGSMCGAAWGQMPSTATTGASQAQTAPGPAGGAVTAEFGAALGPLRQALEGVRLDRWKLSKGLREQTDGDVSSIKRDIDTTLPGLLSAADAVPGTVSAMLPVASNAGALYDVLLRVTERAKVAAPPSQADELVQAQKALEGARRSFADELQKAALAQEQQVAALKQAAKPAVAVACPPAPVAASSTAHVAPKKKKKVVPPPASQ